MTRASIGLALICLLVGCPNGDTPPAPPWQLVYEELPGALLSVWGTSESDVWLVGADARDGMGPLVLHYDGERFERVDTGLDAGTLWWVFGFDGGPVYMGGDGGTIVRYASGVFTPLSTPSTDTVFGIWGASPDDVWAVGGASDARNGFAWRLEGDAWVPEATLPADVPDRAAIWKVFGISPDDVWFVGSNGVSLHWDGGSLTAADTGIGSSLFTVHGNGSRFAAVGGLGNGIIIEYEGGAWHNVTPSTTLPGMSGIYVGADASGVAVGSYGTVYVRDAGGWHEEDTGYPLAENFHAVWVDPQDGIWAVGGQTFSVPLTSGVLLHRGDALPEGAL